MLVDSRTDLEMCLVAVSEKPFCLRLSLTETKRVDGVFLEKDELHPLWTEIEYFVLREALVVWHMFAYAFPSFRFFTPVLHKITGEKCRIVVIAPAWPKQTWFANLLRLSCARPPVLPLKRNILSQFKGGVVHLSPERLHLHTWLLSGIISDRKLFWNSYQAHLQVSERIH
jgi:hypothetical protein